MVRRMLAAAFSSMALCACRAAAPEREYTLVLIKTGPMSGKLTAEESKTAFAGHFSNMERLAEERQLLVAGPFGENRHDPDLRGLFILDSSNRSEAESLASTDPTTQAGVFRLDYHELATDAPLLQALEEDLAWRATAKAEGKTLQPGEGARPYVLLTAEHGDLARKELEPLRSARGGVFFIARLDDTRALALLDAKTIEQARERFAKELDRLGAHELDEWFASVQLARMIQSEPERY